MIDCDIRFMNLKGNQDDQAYSEDFCYPTTRWLNFCVTNVFSVRFENNLTGTWQSSIRQIFPITCKISRQERVPKKRYEHILTVNEPEFYTFTWQKPREKCNYLRFDSQFFENLTLARSQSVIVTHHLQMAQILH